MVSEKAYAEAGAVRVRGDNVSQPVDSEYGLRFLLQSLVLDRTRTQVFKGGNRGVEQGDGAMTPAPQPRAMPVRWALVFAATLSVALAGVTGLVIHLADERPERSSRLFVDWVRLAGTGTAEVYQLRWIEYGQVHMVDVEGADARDRVAAWLSR
jgi:hypothetical protein